MGVVGAAWNRPGLIAGAGRWVLALQVWCGLVAGDAHAYGALASTSDDAPQRSRVSVLLVRHPGTRVTAVVQADYNGSGGGLTWVIPVRGEPSVRQSSSVVFERLEAATGPQYWLEVAVDGGCVDGPDALAGLTAADIQLPAQGPAEPEPAVSVGHEPVAFDGYLTIAPDTSSDDSGRVAVERLADAGYATGGLDAGVLGAYLQEGFNLVAFTLKPERAGGLIRPVVLSYDSEGLGLPFHATNPAADTDLEVRVWVVGPSQAVSTNYPSLVLNDARLDWLSARRFTGRTLPDGGAGPVGAGGSRPGNYDAVVAAATHEGGGQGFVTELAAPASRYRDRLWWSVDDDELSALSERSYEDGVEAVEAALAQYAGWDGLAAAVEAAVQLPSEVTLAAFLAEPGRYRGEVSVQNTELFEHLRTGVVEPVAEAAALLREGPYLTRLAGRVRPAEVGRDPVFAFNFDLAQVDHIHVARQRVTCAPDTPVLAAAFSVETPQGAIVVGVGEADWPAATEAMPASLKVVNLSSEGPGEVVADHSESIARELVELGGGVARPRVPPPRTGVMIGGASGLAPGLDGKRTDPAPRRPRAGLLCSVAPLAVGSGGAGMAWLLVVPVALIGRRRWGARGRLRVWALAACVGGCGLWLGCGMEGADPVSGSDGAGPPPSTMEPASGDLRDPETCKECHPVHFREWSSSMHAYAALDPVFLAMNRRGQRETDGELGDFCIQCHAPMAVVDGLSPDGLNLEELPDLERGVSCFYCHNLEAIEGDHNAQLRVADDGSMRGPFADPVASPIHDAAYSELLDESDARASDACGACHDIVTPNGVRLERTYQEYLTSVFAKVTEGDPRPFETCLSCHMRPRQGFAAVFPGAPKRLVHEHLWPGVDMAVVDFPNRAAMRTAVEDCQLGQSITLFTLEVTPPDIFTFQLETGAGHNQPSGAALDRRLWLEFLAYDDDGELLEDVSSGNIADGEIEEWPPGHPQHDPELLMFRDRTYDAEGHPVHMFWEAQPSEAYPDGYVSQTLPPATTTYLRGEHAVIKQYRASTPDGRLPARVTARLRLRPIGLDVLQDLIDSGDLDPAVKDAMQTLTLGKQIAWTREDGLMTTIPAEEPPVDCASYVCLLDPDSPDCP